MRLDAGRGLHLLSCKLGSDPSGGTTGWYGFTAGGIAAIRAAIPGLPDPAVRLGKPYRPIFEAALDRFDGGRLAMPGDQLATDILGANCCGIDSMLVGSGLAAVAADGSSPNSLQPIFPKLLRRRLAPTPAVSAHPNRTDSNLRGSR